MSVDAKSEPTNEPCWRVVSYWLLGVNLVWSALLSAGIFQSSSKLLRIFESFDMPVSALTTLALSQGFLYVIPVLAVLSVAKEWVLRSSRLNVGINVAHTFLILTVQALYAACAFGPLFQLLDRLAAMLHGAETYIVCLG